LLPKKQFSGGQLFGGLTGSFTPRLAGWSMFSNFQCRAALPLTTFQVGVGGHNKTIVIYCTTTERVTGVILPSFDLENSGEALEILFIMVAYHSQY
jgi:hypothetical protein